MTQTDRFAGLLAGEDARYSLAEACLLIAEDAYPGLDVNQYLAEIERMAARLRGRLQRTADAEEKVIALNQFLFDDLGFYGNADDYYDPRNSYLNEVIERRRGIPITLCILYMEVGRKIDGDGLAGLPIVRRLQNRRAAQATVGKEQVFEKFEAAFAAAGLDAHFARQACQRCKRSPIISAKSQRHQARPWLDNMVPKLPRECIAEV